MSICVGADILDRWAVADSTFVFPNPEALLRLAGAVLVEAHDEWQTGDRRYLAEGTMTVLLAPPATGTEVANRELIPA